MSDLRMNLKVCEGCGALWLRPGVDAGIYCRTCRGRLSDFPAAKGLRRRLGPRTRRLNAVVPANVPANAPANVPAGGAR